MPKNRDCVLRGIRNHANIRRATVWNFISIHLHPVNPLSSEARCRAHLLGISVISSFFSAIIELLNHPSLCQLQHCHAIYFLAE